MRAANSPPTHLAIGTNRVGRYHPRRRRFRFRLPGHIMPTRRKKKKVARVVAGVECLEHWARLPEAQRRGDDPYHHGIPRAAPIYAAAQIGSISSPGCSIWSAPIAAFEALGGSHDRPFINYQTEHHAAPVRGEHVAIWRHTVVVI